MRKCVYSHNIKSSCEKQTMYNLFTKKLPLCFLLMLLLLSFNPKKVISQVNTNPPNNIQLPFHVSCDSLPITFQKVLELTNDPLFTYDLLTYPNGDYLAVGNYGTHQSTHQGFLIKFSPTGVIHWAKEIGAFYPPDPIVFDWYFFRSTIGESLENGIILSDSSAIITGQIISAGALHINEIYLIKIDFNGNILFKKSFDRPNISDATESLVFGINQTEDQSIFINGTFDTDKGLIVRMDKSGQVNKQIVLFEENNKYRAHRQVKYINGYYYLVGKPGNLNSGTPIIERGRISISKFNSNLELVNSIEIFAPPEINRYIVEPLHNYLHNDSLIIIAYYLRNNLNKDEGFGLFGIDYDFNLHFNKIYQDTINEPPISRIGDLAWKADGTIMASFRRLVLYFGAGTFTTNPYFPFATLSPNGDIIEQNAYGSFNSSHQLFDLTPEEHRIVVGRTNDFNVSSPAMTIMRIDSSGSVGECPVTDFELTTTDVPLMIDSINLLTDTFPYPLVDFFLPVKNIYPVAREVCCDALPDATVQWLLPAYTCGDSIGLDISVCNTGDVNLSATYPITIYNRDPCHENASIISSFSLGNIVLANDCYQFTHEISQQNIDTIFLVLGDNGLVSPIQIPCDFPLDGITEECDYYNNFKSVFIPDTIKTTIFQDDYFQNCNEDIFLVAPYYVDNPVWNDTLANDTIIARYGGWYYLRGTTPCGGLFLDSVEVIEQHPHLTPVMDTVCMGDQIVFDNLLFDEKVRVQIFPPHSIYRELSKGDTFFFSPEYSGNHRITTAVTINQVCSRNLDYFFHVLPAPLTTIDTVLCAGPNSIQNQTFTILNDTLLNFNFPFSESCDSTIQYQVSILDTSYQEIMLTACQGDSILFQNTQIAAGDSQTFVNTKTNGCDSTLFVSVEILQPSPITEIFLDFCIGDSILIFNDYQQTSGIYSNTFNNTDGCDSLAQITLTELPIFQTEDLVTLCSGQTAFIHGQAETQAGFYEALFTAENGCDSIAFVELELFATANLEAEILPSCADETSGRIAISIVEGDGPFSFEWSDENNADSLRQNLPPDTYTLTLTDVNGCTSLHGYTVATLTGEDCLPRWYAPNAFSPNDDGRNDRFTFYANARMQEIEILEIFDRQGSLVFRGENMLFNDETLGWDGFLKGQPMNPQVFAWRAVVVDQNGVRESASGDVTLMK